MFKLILLDVVSFFMLGASEAILLRCSSYHFNNSFIRKTITSHVIFVPIGSSLPPYREICYFQFEVPNGFNLGGDLDLTVGDYRLTMKTIQGGVELYIRSLRIEAPWGVDEIIFEMSDDNLGRLIGYFRSLMENENKANQLICSDLLRWLGGFGLGIYAMMLSETIKHFNSRAKLVKLEFASATLDGYFIY